MKGVNCLEDSVQGKNEKMKKTAFVFPGQGSQYSGMAKDFYQCFPEAGEVFETAEKVTGLDLKQLIFGEDERLHMIEYTQIAMLTAELAIWKVLETRGIRPDVCAGLSLGEYAALAVSGCMKLEDIFRIVRKRGIYMQEAYPEGGAMAAVIGADREVIESCCLETDGVVNVANYNCPGQIVISGEEAAVKKASELLMERGARRCIFLNVSGPFHSELLGGAGMKLRLELEQTQISQPGIPYLSNVTADYVKESGKIAGLLEKQVSSPVLFWQSVEKMIADGVELFVEIGPGRTLSSFIKKIDRRVSVLNVEKVADLDSLPVEG